MRAIAHMNAVTPEIFNLTMENESDTTATGRSFVNLLKVVPLFLRLTFRFSFCASLNLVTLPFAAARWRRCRERCACGTLTGSIRGSVRKIFSLIWTRLFPCISSESQKFTLPRLAGGICRFVSYRESYRVWPL